MNIITSDETEMYKVALYRKVERNLKSRKLNSI